MNLCNSFIYVALNTITIISMLASLLHSYLLPQPTSSPNDKPPLCRPKLDQSGINVFHCNDRSIVVVQLDHLHCMCLPGGLHHKRFEVWIIDYNLKPGQSKEKISQKEIKRRIERRLNQERKETNF